MTEARYKPDYMPFFASLIPHHIQFEIRPLFNALDRPSPDSLVVFDIGANRGLWSAAFVHFAAPYTRALHLFEPMPGNLAKIREHLSGGLYEPLAERIVVNERAVSEKSQELIIHYDSEVTPFASAATTETHRRLKTNVSLDKSLRIQAIDIDTYCKDNSIPVIDVMKVDVEGLELPALRGADELLKQGKVRALAFEFGSHQLARRDLFIDFWEFFEERGYDLYHLQTLGRPPRKIPEYSVQYEKFDGMTMFMATARR